MKGMGHLWAILLAAGEGSRVRSLTTDQAGFPTPKQFWPLSGRESLLRRTLQRAERLVPKSRIVLVVAAQHRSWWEDELRDIPPSNVLVQPENRGTAAGVLFPLLHVQRQDPSARVLILPSDHLAEDEDLLSRAMLTADQVAKEHQDRVVLLGVVPDGPGQAYGWIVPEGPVEDGVPRTVRAFIEKPAPQISEGLSSQGGLWNTLIILSTIQALIHLFSNAAPGLLTRFATWNRGARSEPGSLKRLYHDLPNSDFSRDVLEASASSLEVVPVAGSGWVDVGTPESLLPLLGRLEPHEPLGQPIRT